MNCGAQSPDKVLPLCHLNLNWENCIDPQSSILSSPSPASIAVQISSFMDDPLNSMHANHMMQFPNDLGFVERAARYSSFNGGNFGAHPYQFGIQEAGKRLRAPNIKFHMAKESPTQSRTPSEVGEGETGSGREDSSVTDPAPARGESNAKKRKAAPKSKGKVAEEDDRIGKTLKSGRSTTNEKDGCMPKEEETDVKNPDQHKDYIHVRARRGQATDSHSLAERVRREKISQRMKLLQALVPGCSKITGKALMLDEIINYVQSLQRQVEFLSMKLATVDPRHDFNLETLISKESAPHQTNASMLNSLYHLDNLSSAFSLGHQSKEGNHLCFTVTNAIGTMSTSLRSSLDICGGVASQAGNLWDEELHTVLQAGFSQNQEIGETSQSFNAQLSTAHMKIKL